MSERLRVLLVEDNPADVDLIRETLPENGPVTFRLESVSRLAEARARVATGDLDLILLDLGLPDSHGLATFDSLREAAPDIPIVVLTGNDDEEAAVAAVRQGAQDYLIKGQVVGNLLARAARYAVERKRGDDALRESERKLKEAQRLGRIGHWEFDSATHSLLWSDVVFEIYERDPALGPPSVDVEAAYYAPEDATRLRGAGAAAIEAGEPYELAVQINLPGGRLKHVVAIGKPVRDDQGRIVKLLGTVQDITRRKLAEEALRKSEARSLKLLDNVPFPLCHVTKAGVIAFRNRRFVQVFGYTADDVPTLAEWWLRAYPDPHYRQWVTATWDAAVRRAAAEGRDIDAVEYRVTCKSGEERVVVISGITLGEEFLATFIDITERRRAEEARAHREAELLESQRIARIGSWEWTLASGARAWSAGMAHILARDPGLPAPTAEALPQFFTPESWQRLTDAMDRAVATGASYDLETEMIRADGTTCWTTTRGEALRGANGTVVKLRGTVLDIDERKRAERELLESKQLVESVVENAPFMIFLKEAKDLRFVVFNKAGEDLLGYDSKDLLGKNNLDLFPPEQAAFFTAKDREVLAGEVLVDIPEEPIQTARKGERLLHTRKVCIKGADGVTKYLLGISDDITDRKRDEKRIVHLNRILRAVRDINQLIVRERDRQRLIEDTCRLLVESRGYRSAMVILSDAAGVPHAWAEAGMGELFQPLAESLRLAILPACCRLATPCEGVYHVTDREEVCRLCPIGTDCAGSDASCIQLRHGETTYGYLSVSVARTLGVDAEEDSLLGEVAGDVAFALHGIERAEAMTQAEEDRDRAEAQLRQSQKMEAVGRLAGGVAHDFNNILTVIVTSCSFLEEGLQESEPLLEDVRTIHASSQSAARLTRQLLAFSRRQVLEPRPLDLNALVADSEKMLNRLIGEDITIRVEAAPALGLVLVDPGQFEQVVINLAVNARDAMPDGGTLTITTANVELDEVFVSGHAGSGTGPHVRLAVTDTGMGMDAETLERVFEPFFTTKEMGKGTGLGLSTVYGIVKQSGGYVTADSAPGRGATFEILLPRVASVAQPWQPPGDTGPSRGRGETILLVEDNDELRAVATRALKNLGYRVFGATGLEEAGRIAATEEPIHLLLTDVVMPGGSGRDVCAAVAAAHPAVKVLYMSGFTDEAIVHRGVLEPGVAFLPKPFGRDALGRKVREVLDG